MVNIPLVDRLGNFTENTFERSRLDTRPANLSEIISQYARPHTHTIIYTKLGYIQVQERKETKKSAKGLVFPFHGGHITEQDLLEAQKRGNVQSAYRIGGGREIGEELGLSVDSAELRFVTKKYFKENEISILDYNMFVKVFDLIYDRTKHGSLRNFNRAEIEDLYPLTVEDVEKAGLFAKFGDKMGSYLLNHIKETSFKIRHLGYEHVLKEMSGETDVVKVPQDILDISTLEISPETAKEMLGLKKTSLIKRLLKLQKKGKE